MPQYKLTRKQVKDELLPTACNECIVWVIVVLTIPRRRFLAKDIYVCPVCNTIINKLELCSKIDELVYK